MPSLLHMLSTHMHGMYCHAILVMKSLNLFVEKDQRITMKISVKPDNVLHCKKCSKITLKCPKLPTVPQTMPMVNRRENFRAYGGSQHSLCCTASDRTQLLGAPPPKWDPTN